MCKTCKYVVKTIQTKCNVMLSKLRERHAGLKLPASSDLADSRTERASHNEAKRMGFVMGK
jgi:hypothetical protein